MIGVGILLVAITAWMINKSVNEPMERDAITGGVDIHGKPINE
jgi:hypothetical protein